MSGAPYHPVKNPVMSGFFMHNQKLESVDAAKYLGVSISQDMSWNTHMRHQSGAYMIEIKVKSKKLKEGQPDGYQTTPPHSSVGQPWMAVTRKQTYWRASQCFIRSILSIYPAEPYLRPTCHTASVIFCAPLTVHSSPTRSR